ncbi:AMP-binding protein, partial [Clostridium sp. D2Q-14]|uniref:condensation domain-containing protein n=1 Tax=Anaeromonas gelatinilytica TaxID=2683194 RepID=UPI00193B2949
EELTKEKFIENPFGEGRMYRSGDLVRWLPDGNIEYLGRIDEQVKIRGYRVEIKEIEEVLIKQEGIEDSVVIVEEMGKGNKILLAYTVMKEAKELDTVNLKEDIRKELPDYMIPQYFKAIDKIPLNANGKLDKRVLPEIEFERQKEYVKPTTLTEKRLCEVYKELLNIDKIGRTDNFFELGGHSILAMELVNLIKEDMGKDIAVSNIFEYSSVKDLASFIDSLQTKDFDSIPLAEKALTYPITSSPKRLFTLQEMNPESTSYNMPFGVEVKGNFDIELLCKTYEDLIKRHEILRTSFHTKDGNFIQRIDEDVVPDISILDYSKDINNELSKKKIMREFVKPFKVDKASLIRLRLIKLSENHGYILFDTHHMISDALSMKIFIEEFAALYNGEELEDLKIQYKDYSQWVISKDISSQEEYWNKVYETPVEALNLPYDSSRPKIKSFNGDLITIDLEEKFTNRIQSFAREKDLTEYMVLLSGLMITLHQYSYQDDIVIGSPITGRIHKDTEKMLGMFVNTLAIRGYPESDKTLEKFFEEIKNHCLGAYENQEYPFEKLVDKVIGQRDSSRNPLFDVSFALQNAADFTLGFNNMEVKDVFYSELLAKFDIDIEMSYKEKGYHLSCIYNTDLFRRKTIEGMMDHFIKLLLVITEDMEQKIGELNSLTDEERNEITKVFNDVEIDYNKDLNIKEIFE